VLDAVSDGGTVEGWALYRDSLAVCHIQVRLGGVVLGEDMADKFRLDLLRSGLRYGHCAFYASIPITRPGSYPLELVDGRTGRPINPGEAQETFVPAFAGKPPQFGRAIWTDEQILENLVCLQLEMNYHKMGAEKFVDAVFRFGLGRWADPAALDGYCAGLRAQSLSPVAVFEAVLMSEERKRQDRRLPSPFEADFPFDYELAPLPIE
jgi:hypothetical protein